MIKLGKIKFVVLVLICSFFEIIMTKKINLIVNSDFSQNNCPMQAQYCLYTATTYQRSVKEWSHSSQLQIAYGRKYHRSYLSKQRVIVLAGRSNNTCIAQKLPILQATTYCLVITYIPRQGHAIANSAIRIYLSTWNRTITPTQYYPKSAFFQIPITTSSSYTLQICGSTNQNTISSSIINVQFYKKQYQYGPITTPINSLTLPSSIRLSNLIKNFDFSNTTCVLTICQYSIDQFVINSSLISHWLPKPYILITYGTEYFNSSRVIRLSNSANQTCISQTVNNLTIGKYEIYVLFFVMANATLNQSKFSVSLNGVHLKIIHPHYRAPKIQKIEFQIQSFLVNGTIQFCGLNDPKNSSVAAYLKEVALVAKQPEIPIRRASTFDAPQNASIVQEEQTTSLLFTSHSDLVKQIFYVLQVGSYRLKFQYKAFRNQYIKNTKLQLKFNGVIQATFLLNNSFTNEVSINVIAVKGKNKLEIYMIRDLNQFLFHLMIKDLRVVKTVP